MKTLTFKITRLSLIGIAVVFAFVFILFGSHFTAHAASVENTSYVETSQGDRFYYKKVEDAINKAYDGGTIVMTSDWRLIEAAKIAEGKTVTIDMNGHKITERWETTDFPAFWVSDRAELTLKSTAEAHTFTYNAFNNDGTEFENKVCSGGLITGIKNAANVGGIVVCENAKCTLDNVAIAGNRGYYGGGVLIGKNSNLYMSNGTAIQYNRSVSDGGGIYVNGEDSHIFMNNSFVEHNSGCKGAGVFSDKDGTRIFLEKNSSISYNVNSKNEQGGGVYFDEDYSSVSSNDGTGIIKGNEGNIGGGVTFKGSHSGAFGCTITENNASSCGGGIWTGSSSNKIQDCTITKNKTRSGGAEGGGVYVADNTDITLSGKVIIKDNVREVVTMKNNSEKSTWTTPDDLFLTEGWFTDSYILGGVDAGSSVGIRTGSTGKSRMIGQNITTYYDGTYFMDLSDSYYVSHGSDHNGDLWQRKL